MRLRGLSPITLAVAVGAVVGAALRVWILLSSAGVPDADEAVWGLMAMHTLDGELDAFFWGQAYGGTQETLLSAPIVAVAGSSYGAVRVVPIVLHAVAAVLTWRVGIRTVGEPYARLAGVLVWSWSAYAVWKSTRAHGFYGAAIVLGLLAILLALRLYERDSKLDAALLGLVCGLGWWATSQVAILALPAVLWLIVRRPGVVRLAPYAIPPALVGAAPAIAANVKHGGYSFVTGARQATPFEQTSDFFVTNLPAVLGLRRPFSLEWIPVTAVGGALYALIFVGFVYLVSRRPERLEPLLLIALALPLFYALSPYAALNTEPRYLFVAVPVLGLLLVALMPSVRTALALLVAAFAFSVAGAAGLEAEDVAVSFVFGEEVPADLDPLLAFLEGRKVEHAFANYWIAWRITFESGERIIAVPPGSNRYARRGDRVTPVDGELGRYPPFYRRVAASADAAYVFLAGDDREHVARTLLAEAGYTRRRVADFVVYLPRSDAS